MYQNGRLFSPYHHVDRRQSVRPAQPCKPISAAMACGLLLPLDIVALVGSASLAYVIWLVKDPYSSWTEYGLVVAFGTLLAVNLFHLAGLYDADILRQPGLTIRRVVVSWFGVAAVLVAASFLTKTSEEYSRLWAVLWLGLGLATLVGLRWFFFAQTARWASDGRLLRNVAIVGTGTLAERLVAQFVANPAAGVRIAGVFTDADRPIPLRRGRGAPDGNLQDLVIRIRREPIDTVIIALPKLAERRLLRILDQLSEVPVDIRMCPGPVALRLTDRGISHYAGVPTLNVTDRPLADWRYAAKEIEDRLLATFILLLIAPVMIAISVLIKIDSPGPVFFRQKRYGYNNQLIEVLKFRTMYNDRQDPRAEQLTRRDDPRVTPIGAFLRRWSLDELPQFINVLCGEMSIVGPRPHAVSAKAGGLLYQEAVSHYAARHRVKPGITGWAQINGWRGTTETVRQIQKRVEHDLYYIENWSLWLDLKIIFLTIFKGFTGQNAY
jgi:Undecaprenyl-phosphate glucose phosphotransferase